MSAAVVALIIAIVAAGGAIFAIFKATSFATRKSPKQAVLPEGQYIMRKVAGTEDTYDLTLIETPEDESGDKKEAKKDN